MTVALVLTLMLSAQAGADPADGAPAPEVPIVDAVEPVGDAPPLPSGVETPPPDTVVDEAPDFSEDSDAEPPSESVTPANGVLVHRGKHPLPDAMLLTLAGTGGAALGAAVGASVTAGLVLLTLPTLGMVAPVAGGLAIAAGLLTPGLAGLGAGAAVLLIALDDREGDWENLLTYVAWIYISAVIMVAAVATIGLAAATLGSVLSPLGGLGDVGDVCADAACHMIPPIFPAPSDPPSKHMPPPVVSGPALGAILGVSVGMVAGSALGMTGALQPEDVRPNYLNETMLTAAAITAGALAGAGIGAGLGAVLETNVEAVE